MGRRNDHSRDELREMAIQAAERIVETEGLAGLTTRKVAAGIGYTVGTLYLVFRNLDDLVFQVNGRTLDRLFDALRAPLQGCTGPVECVRILAHGYARFAREEPRRWAALYDYTPPETEPLPEWYGPKIDRLLTLVEESLGGAGGQHRLPARVLWGAVHGICVLKLTHRMEIAGSEPAEALIDSLIDNYLAGLARPAQGE